MSLTDWVDWDKELFKTWIPHKPKLDIMGELKAPPISKNYGTVGTAFDYVLRLLINRENVDLVSGFHIVAEHSIGKDKYRKSFVNEFKNKQHEYVSDKSMKLDELLPMCIILAKMDSEYRCGLKIPDDDLFSYDTKDIKDLKNLVSLVDISQFKAKERCLLNPTFGKSSQDIGGADADLVIDNTMIDIKTIKNLEFTAETFRQLMGYYLLHLRENKAFGDIKHLGIYYSRFGLLWKFEPEMVDPVLFEDIAFLEEISHDAKINIGEVKELRKSFWDEVEDSIKQYQEA